MLGLHRDVCLLGFRIKEPGRYGMPSLDITGPISSLSSAIFRALLKLDATARRRNWKHACSRRMKRTPRISRMFLHCAAGSTKACRRPAMSATSSKGSGSLISTRLPFRTSPSYRTPPQHASDSKNFSAPAFYGKQRSSLSSLNAVYCGSESESRRWLRLNMASEQAARSRAGDVSA